MSLVQKHFVVVLDHREARIHRIIYGKNAPETIIRLDPHGAHRYLHNVGDHDNGQRKPEFNLFYKRIVDALVDADQILIYGHAQGASSAMHYLIEDMKKLHPDLARQIVGYETVDVVHLTYEQLLARARHFFHPHESTRSVSTRG